MARTTRRTKAQQVSKEVQLLSDVERDSFKCNVVTMVRTDWKGNVAEVVGEETYQNVKYLWVVLKTFANGKLRPEGRQYKKMVLPTSVEPLTV